MDIIVLTGGQGRRLGALSAKVPKAALNYRGRPLLTYVLDSIFRTGVAIGKVHIATGRGHKRISDLLHTEGYLRPEFKLEILEPEPSPTGTFGSLVNALRLTGVSNQCLVVGIDVLIPPIAIADLVGESLRTGRTEFLVSHNMEEAPTHGIIRLRKDGRILGYQKRTNAYEMLVATPGSCDVGIRVLSKETIDAFLIVKINDKADFDDVIPGLVDNGHEFFGRLTSSQWLHFAVAKDFSKPGLWLGDHS